VNVEIVSPWDVHLSRSITECVNNVNWCLDYTGRRTLRELYSIWYMALLGFIL